VDNQRCYDSELVLCLDKMNAKNTSIDHKKSKKDSKQKGIGKMSEEDFRTYVINRIDKLERTIGRSTSIILSQMSVYEKGQAAFITPYLKNIQYYVELQFIAKAIENMEIEDARALMGDFLERNIDKREVSKYRKAVEDKLIKLEQSRKLLSEYTREIEKKK